MPTLTADSPPAPASEPGQPDLPPGEHQPPVADAAQSPVPEARSCAKCAAAMAPGQDWCLQCGAGAPGSVGSSPGWRSAATILGVAVVLALGAAAAAYAALSKETKKPPTVTTTVAQATTPTATTPVTPTTVPSTPTVKSPLPLNVNPPKIPLTATPTPKGSTPTQTNTQGNETGSSTKTTPSSSSPAVSGEENQPSSILLDTNAAATYNPYNYPASDFGDPSLTIDGDTSTGWTAIVEPATAPKMAEGVLIDLKTPHKLAALKLVSTTPGMTVQVYGANGKAAPTSITDPAWAPLSHSQTFAKKHVRIKLRDQKKAFTFVTLWISQAPAASVGTPEAPGHVSVNEIELFPAQ
jgi:hypothetical protein